MKLLFLIFRIHIHRAITPQAFLIYLLGAGKERMKRKRPRLPGAYSQKRFQQWQATVKEEIEQVILVQWTGTGSYCHSSALLGVTLTCNSNADKSVLFPYTYSYILPGLFFPREPPSSVLTISGSISCGVWDQTNLSSHPKFTNSELVLWGDRAVSRVSGSENSSMSGCLLGCHCKTPAHKRDSANGSILGTASYLPAPHTGWSLNPAAWEAAWVSGCSLFQGPKHFQDSGHCMETQFDSES